MAVVIMGIGWSAPLDAATIRTVGTFGTYTSLSSAITDVNNGTLTGDVELQITSNLTVNTTVTLNASGGSSNYTSLRIYPTGATRTITGTAAPMLDLAGADNVTIDGRLNQTGAKSLTISSNSTSGIAFRFINGASSNTIKYCDITGRNTTATSGVIIFSTTTSTGNNSNVIEYCDIKDGSSTPTNLIYALGTASAPNSGNIIRNCNIYNFFSTAAATNGILLSTNNTNWTISYNRFFQSSTRVGGTTARIHHAINIVSTSGNNFTVSNNTIGYLNSSGTGKTFYNGGNVLFRAIELSVGTTTPSNIQGNTISGITFTTSSNSTGTPGIFNGISILAGSVNIGTTAANTIGATSENGAITVTSTSTGPLITGIYATSSGVMDIENNNIGGLSNGTSTTIAYTLRGIHTVGTGTYTISNNLIGSTSTTGSIAVGTSTSGTVVYTFYGISSTGTGVNTINGNTIQNCTTYGAAASVFNGIANTGGSGTLSISNNKIIAGTNTGTGTITAISNNAAVATLNINGNIIRSLSKTVASGNFIGISNSGAATSAIAINNNDLGDTNGGLITFSAAYTGTVTGITNTAGASTASLQIQGNDVRGIVHSAAATGAHTYITNIATTSSQDISNNTFTALSVNTTGNITFISNNAALSATGVQNISNNSIVTSFAKTGDGGSIFFCNDQGSSSTGSIITHNLNNFSNVTVPTNTTISGWVDSNSSLNKTFNANTFKSWSGSSKSLTVMNITSGASAITGNTISNITTGTAAAASITAITTGASGALTISNNTISGLASGAAGYASSFTGINANAGTDLTIADNSITGCTAGGTSSSSFTGITTTTSGTGALTILRDSIISGTNAGTGAFNVITNSGSFSTIIISSNVIRSNTVSTASSTFSPITNYGAATTSIAINNNQLGNSDGGLVKYTLGNTTNLVCINNSAGGTGATLSIQGNDVRGIEYTSTGTGSHTYINSAASTLSQTISDNTFTNIIANTTGNITFISVSANLAATGTQTVDNNAIVTGFQKTGAGGNIYFCSSSGTSTSGSMLNHTNNNFSNVTVTSTSLITGWYESNTCLNKTISNNTFMDWSGSSGSLTVLSISGGASTISANTIKNISTGTAAASSITVMNTGASGAISITGNTIENVTTGAAAYNNSFTGIYNVSGVNVSITGNTLTGCKANGTGSSSFTGINTNSAGSGTLAITGNSILSGSNAGTGAFTPIVNSVAFTAVNISNNIIRNLTMSSATSTFTAISNSGAVTGTIALDNNQLGNADGGLITYPVASSGALIGISNTGGTTACALSMQGNNIQGITHSLLGSSPHTYLSNTASILTQNISSNTFTNLSVLTTGAIVFILNDVAMPANGVQNINSNRIVTGFAKTGTGNTVTLFASTISTANTGIQVNNNNNDFSNMTVTGTTMILGWTNTDAGTASVTKTINGNTFSNWTASTGAITVLNVNITSANNATSNNLISSINSAGNIDGIITAAGNDNIFSNTIHSLVSTGTGSTRVNGISITAGTLKKVYQNTIYNIQANNTLAGNVNGIVASGSTTNQIYRNKIYNIASSSSGITGCVNGILISGSTGSQTNTIHNNIIGHLQASATSNTNAICGISISNTGSNSTNNVYYNTIYLNATSTGTNFGSSGIYHITSTTATTATLTLRNNIIINNSTAKGSGLTVAFRRSAGAASNLANYGSTSNNNLFYAGVPSASQLIYSDGTSSAQTIAAYKSGAFTAGTISPRDQLSITEKLRFASLTGADANYLKMSFGAASYIESGGASISGFDVDYEGSIRSGSSGYPAQTNGYGTAPDIGADEFDGFIPHILVSNSNTESDGFYGNLYYTFIGLNAQDQTGKSILVSLLMNSTEALSAKLNAGNWTSLTIFPSLTGLSISGSLAGSPLIDLDGASNVVIDGRVNYTGSTKDMIITNTSTSSTAGTATLRFMNSAQSNTVKYCTIKGSTTSTIDGVLMYSTSASGTGNKNNTIDLCNLTNNSGSRPVNLLYSSGTAGRENSLNTISNSAIYDFLNGSNSSNGLYIGANSTDWSVLGNSFYETSSLVPTTGSFTFSALRIDNSSGNNFNISNNYFGGKAALCGGAAWSTAASTNHSMRVVNLNVGTGTATSVQNNAFKNWSYSSANATPWGAISVNGGNVNIGTTSANTIGAETGTSNITLTSTANAESYGIYLASTGTVVVSNNKIGAIQLVGNSTNVSHSFTGVYQSTPAGTYTISGNLIGSTSTASSINASSAAASASIPQFVRAFYNSSSGTSTISQNTIANLVSASTLGSVVGIELNGSGANCTVSKNDIYALSNAASAFTGFVAGINQTGSLGTNSVQSNFIRTLTVPTTATSSSIYGIRVTSGTTTYSNNIISLVNAIPTTLYGIYESGAASNTNRLYFNTVYLGGTLSSGVTNKSYALYSNTSANIRNIRNNIFANYRATTSGTNLHYAAYLNYAVNTNLTLDYNDYYAPGIGGVLGYFNGGNKTSLPMATGNDAKSQIANPTFVNGGSTSATDYKVNTAFVGVSGTGISADYGLTARDLPVNMGAFEYYPIKWKGSISSDFSTAGNWTTSTVPNGSQIVGISPEIMPQPTISGASPANDVTISSGGRIDLLEGATMILESGPLLTLASGTNIVTKTGGRIVLKSGARYINLSTCAPTLEVQRSLTASKGWRMVSAPVKEDFAGMFTSPLVTQGFTGSTFPDLQPNLLWWLESDGGTALQSWRKPVNVSDSLSSGRGYFHYVFNGAERLTVDGNPTGSNYTDVVPVTMSSVGVENFNGTGSFNYNLSYTAKASSQTPSAGNTTYYDLNALDQGWNLIGNPTASTLDWDAASGWTKTNIDNTIYIWDPSALAGNGNYLVWNGTTGSLGNGRIAPYQAFWTHATAATTLSFTNAVKSSSAGTFLRSTQVDETVSLPITLSLGNLNTTSFLSFSPNGTIGPDRWDGYQLESMSENRLELYTLSSPSFVSPLVINHLPILDENLVDIPLYINAQLNGSSSISNCTLSWTLPENWPSDWKISLLDHQSEKSISMMENSTYSYQTKNKASVQKSLTTMPKKIIKSLSDSIQLRSTSLPPFSIVISKGSDIEYMGPKPELLGSFPNPFKKMSTIRFTLPQRSKALLEIYSSQGRKIETLANDFFPAGISEISWDALNNAPGLYFIRFVSGTTVETKKAILIN